MSLIDPKVNTTHICTIVDDGSGPKFQIHPEDQMNAVLLIDNSTPTAFWRTVVNQAKKIRDISHSKHANGPYAIGLENNPTIAKLIQGLP
jgi:hypothetical protein